LPTGTAAIAEDKGDTLDIERARERFERVDRGGEVSLLERDETA
jgi:hypothetical protein